MGAEAEPDVRIRVASDVEAERVVEHRLVTVGRRVEQDHPVAGRRRPGSPMWVSTAAVRKKLLSGVTQRIISSTASGMLAGIGGQRLPLVGVVAEGAQAAGDHRAGGLGATAR